MEKRELTRKEKNYIISDLISATDSCNTSNRKFTITNFEKAKFKDFDMSEEDEFELIKSILRKLNTKNISPPNPKGMGIRNGRII